MLRLVVASVWLYEGLWRKVLRRDPHELAVIAAAPRLLPPATLLAAIGWSETLLALAVLSGRHRRQLAAMQVVLVLAMNGLGIAFAGGTAIKHPLRLIVRNVPFLACVVALGASQ